MNITDGATHQVALYNVDWDFANTRAQRVEVVNTSTGAVLDTRTITAFSTGQYLVWTIGGHVTFRVTNTGAMNAVVSGLFFDPAGSSPPPPPSASAAFVRTDTTTQGNWLGVYGSKGYGLANIAAALPSYAQVAWAGQQSWTCDASAFKALSASSYAAAAYRSRAALKVPCACAARMLPRVTVAVSTATTQFLATLMWKKPCAGRRKREG